MREFKFRTWDKLKQVFVKGSVAFEYDDFEWVVLDYNNDHILSNYSGYINQYTGLVDKNGVEICEGDIVKSTVNNYYWIYEITTATYQYGNTLFAMLLEDNLTTDEDDNYTLEARNRNKDVRNNIPFGSRCEIIGNIYENEELLNKIKKD